MTVQNDKENQLGEEPTNVEDWIPPYKEEGIDPFATPFTEVEESNDVQALVTVDDALALLKELDGFIACGVGEHITDSALGLINEDEDFEAGAMLQFGSELLKNKKRTLKRLHLEDEIEDIVLSMAGQYHLIRPLSEYPKVFAFLALDSSRANLALARFKLAEVSKHLSLPPSPPEEELDGRSTCDGFPLHMIDAFDSE
ncbi:MAG: hypothetical protein VYE40_11690 [Myxococcota bacterium]|nr:hypothetical protein [Myxococcota bacterium]